MSHNAYNRKGSVIRISEQSLIQMILSGLEAYSISYHTGKNIKKSGNLRMAMGS